MTFEFFCPTPDCTRMATYAEDVSRHDRATTPAAFAVRARVAALSHGWVVREALPGGAAVLKALLVCPDCACVAIDCSRVSWTETDRVGRDKENHRE